MTEGLRVTFEYSSEVLQDRTIHQVSFKDDTGEFVCVFVGSEKEMVQANLLAALMLLRKFDIFNQEDVDLGMKRLSSLMS